MFPCIKVTHKYICMYMFASPRSQVALVLLSLLTMSVLVQFVKEIGSQKGLEEHFHIQGLNQEFLFEGQVATLIYLLRQPPHTHIFIHIYIHTLFYLTSYIYTHTQLKKKKKKTLVFSIKIIFYGNLS